MRFAEDTNFSNAPATTENPTATTTDKNEKSDKKKKDKKGKTVKTGPQSRPLSELKDAFVWYREPGHEVVCEVRGDDDDDDNDGLIVTSKSPTVECVPFFNISISFAFVCRRTKATPQPLTTSDSVCVWKWWSVKICLWATLYVEKAESNTLTMTLTLNHTPTASSFGSAFSNVAAQIVDNFC